MGYSNLPDDWNSFYTTCECGKRVHASYPSCDSCENGECPGCGQPLEDCDGENGGHCSNTLLPDYEEMAMHGTTFRRRRFL